MDSNNRDFLARLTLSDPGMMNPDIENTDMKIFLWGKQATATITKASQTGLMINDQPMIQFNLNYKDESGQIHFVQFKKIVLLTEMDRVKLRKREILYLEDEPQKIAFIE